MRCSTLSVPFSRSTVLTHNKKNNKNNKNTLSPPPLAQDEILDLYTYYAVMAMSSPLPPLRAAGVNILASLSSPAPAVIIEHLPRLVELKDEDWWQTSVALIKCTSGLLAQLQAAGPLPPPSTEGAKGGIEESIAACSSILSAILDSSQALSPSLAQIFVSEGPSILPACPSLVPKFVQTVLNLSPSACENLLGVNAWGQFLAQPDTTAAGAAQKGGGGSQDRLFPAFARS